jgi:hypothetical protein
MKKLLAAFREWLIEVWDFVPREDYRHVQHELSMATDDIRFLSAQVQQLSGNKKPTDG